MKTRMLVVSDSIGFGDEELGRVLMKNFLYSVARAEQQPVSIAFMNGGVRLTCEGSSSLDDLQLLADNGVDIRSCGTCLDYLGLKDALVVGDVGTMPDTVAAVLGDDRLVTIG